MSKPPILPAKQRAHQPTTSIDKNTGQAIEPRRAINDYCDRLWHNHSDRSPHRPAASIIFYRERQDAPVHAIAAEIWQGSRKVLNVKPMHCLGLSPSQVVGMMADILKACSTELNVELNRFASKVELHPSLCPIRPCPLCDRNPSTTNTNN
jgi:hypothetical protein